MKLLLPPVPRPAFLDPFEGRWVAVKAGAVIADGPTSSSLIPMLRAMGPDASDAVVEYVPPPTTSYRVGAG